MGSTRLTRQQAFRINQALGNTDTSQMTYQQVRHFIKETVNVTLVTTGSINGLLKDMGRPIPASRQLDVAQKHRLITDIKTLAQELHDAIVQVGIPPSDKMKELLSRYK